MRIARVTLHNYRQYPDFMLDLSEAEVALIIARIGTGKTNLLNAMTWCLYGKELLFDGSDSGLDMRSVIPSDSNPTFVELRIKFDDGREALLLRELVDPMTLSAVQNGPGKLTVQEARSSASGFEPVANPDEWVKRYLPQRIQPYFLINAERVIQFSSDTGALPVQKAVLQIAQIDTLERMVRHLETVRAEYIQDLKKYKTDAETEELADNIGRLDGSIASLRQEIAGHREEIEFLDSQLVQNDDDLDRLRQSSETIERFKSLDQRYRILSAEYSELDRRLNSQYATLAPFMFAHAAVERLNGAIADALNRNILPPPVSVDYLRSLLEKGSCVCGCALEPGSAHRASLEQSIALLEGVSLQGHRLNELRVPLSLLERSRSDSITAVDGLKKQARAMLEDLETVERDLDQAREDADGIKEENVRELLSARRRAEDSRRENQRQFDRKTDQLAEASRTRDALQADLKRKLKKQDAGHGLASTLEFVDQCVAAAQKAYEEIALETRQAVSTKLWELFRVMHWDASKYNDASIDDGYAIHVIDSSSKPGERVEALGTLSDGEKVLLAMAFSQALAEVSGFELPVVFDSPLVKLDKYSKVLVADSLVKHVTNRQLVLLMKPGEYDDTIESSFAPRHPLEWELVSDGATRSTTAVRKV